MSATTRTDEERALDRASKLIAKANAAGVTDEERETLMDAANRIITKYAIDRAVAEAHGPKVDREAVESREMSFPFYDSWSEWREHFVRMWAYVARNCRLRFTPTGMHDGKIVLVGMSGDIEYAQMIWTSVYFGFMSRLDPTWDAAQTAEYNVKMLKESGRKWIDIKAIADRHGFETKPNDGKLKAAYRRQCKIEGIVPTPHTSRHDAYRRSYAEGFQQSILDRLNRQFMQQEDDTKSTTGAEVALRDLSSYVDEEFYALYPDERPKTREEWAAERAKQAEEDAARQAAEEERRKKLTPKQRAAEDVRNERERIRAEKYWDERERLEYDDRGAQAGRRAGHAVDLTGGKNSLHTENTTQIGN